MTSILTVLFGVPQSQYAAIAFIISCIVCTTIIIINNNNISLYDKLIIVFIAFIISIPGVALTFLQLTCIVTGAGIKNTQWWCNIYAWILSIIIIFYSLCLIISVFIPISNNKNSVIYNTKINNCNKSNNLNNNFNNRYKDTFADIDIINNLIKASSSNINTGNTSNLVGTAGNLGNAGNVGNIGTTDSNLLPFEYNDQLTFADILNNSR